MDEQQSNNQPVMPTGSSWRNKLIKNSYIISVVMTCLLLGFVGFSYGVAIYTGLGGGVSEHVDNTFRIIILILFMLTSISYVLALIHAIKQGRVVLTCVYAFLVMVVAIISIIPFLPI